MEKHMNVKKNKNYELALKLLNNKSFGEESTNG
jgi:hypothetical protein